MKHAENSPERTWIIMIIIGEKINGAIPSIKKAIAEHDEALIVERTLAQAKAGADFLDCAPSTATDIEYETMVWLIGLMQGVTQTPLCIDSPNAKLLARILEEGHVARPGMVNSVNEEGDKCETIFPLIAGTPWHVVGLTCDRDGIPADPEKKIDIAKRIIDKADKYGVALNQLHIDPCVMAIATMPTSMKDFERCIRGIHEYAPTVKVTGAISNISFDMPARKYVNMNCMAYAIAAGLDSAIMDPCNMDMIGTIYACEALTMKDKIPVHQPDDRLRPLGGIDPPDALQLILHAPAAAEPALRQENAKAPLQRGVALLHGAHEQGQTIIHPGQNQLKVSRAQPHHRAAAGAEGHQHPVRVLNAVQLPLNSLPQPVRHIVIVVRQNVKGVGDFFARHGETDFLFQRRAA